MQRGGLYIQTIIVRQEHMNSFRIRKESGKTAMVICTGDLRKIAEPVNARIDDLLKKPETSALEIHNNVTGVKRHFMYKPEASSTIADSWQCVEDPNLVLLVKH